MRGRKILVWNAAAVLILLAVGAFGFWSMGKRLVLGFPDFGLREE